MDNATVKQLKKKAKAAAVRNQPTASEMVLEAIETLAERKGSSLYAIKKFISDTYGATIDTRLKNKIKKTINSSIEEGILIRKSGVGVSGSFKLAKKRSETKVRSASSTKVNGNVKGVAPKKQTSKRAIEESEREKKTAKKTAAKKQKTR